MRQTNLASSITSTARPSYGSGDVVASQTTVRRVSTEIDALWQLTETLATLAAHPVAALEHVTRTAGELTAAEAAAVLLHPGSELVLASRWGIVGIPLGYKSPDIRRALDATWTATASMPIRSGTHEVGCLWVARGGGAFSADEQRVLRTLASITSLALPSLVDTKKTASRAPDVTPAATEPPRATERPHAPVAPSFDHARLVPETLHAIILPTALTGLLQAIDEGADVDAIAAPIEADPVLSTLVLRAGNCAAAGRARPTGRLREAIVFLGMQRLRTLALANFARSLVPTAGALDVLMWELAIGTSVRTQQLVLVLDAGIDADAARLAGLLHPMGTLALALGNRDRYEGVLRTSIRDDRALDDVERAAFGTDGPTVTQHLAHAWHLEPALPASLRGSGAPLALRDVLDWATHVSLSANPIWQRFVTDAGLGAAPRWVARRIAAGAHALDLDDGRSATIGAMSTVALDKTRRLLATP
jgi:hypothetical protein